MQIFHASMKENEMSSKIRINYALSIKHWCDANPEASDAELVTFLERIECKVAKDRCDRSSQSSIKSALKANFDKLRFA